MKLNIKSIKRTRIGRLWLAEFVRRIWETLVPYERDALLTAKRGVVKGSLADSERRALRGLFAGTRGRPLTDLGAEVAAYGRRVHRGRARRRKS